MTPLCLAYWIMSDGYYNQGTVYLCTESFTYKEINLLINAIQSNMGLICSPVRRIS